MLGSYGPKKLWRIFSRHVDTLMYPFQPILSDYTILEGIREKRYRWQNLFPAAVGFGILLDAGYIYLVYGNDPTNPMFFHQVIMKFMPVFFLERSNVVYPCLFLLTGLCFSHLLLGRCPHLPFILYQPEAENRPGRMILPYRKGTLRLISESLGNKIVKFYPRWHRNSLLIGYFLNFQLNVGFTFPLAGFEFYQVYATSGEYLPRFRDIACMFVAPLYFFYLGSTTQIGMQFMAQLKIIQLKQKHYLAQMGVGSFELAQVQPIVVASYFRFYYAKCFRTMAKILDLSREIDAFNKFYTVYVTFTMVLFIFTGCSVLNAVVTGAGEAPFLFTFVWFCYVCLYFGYLFFFNATSSRCILLNLELFKKLRQTQIKLLSSRKLSRLQIVKLDLVNEYKLFLQH